MNDVVGWLLLVGLMIAILGIRWIYKPPWRKSEE